MKAARGGRDVTLRFIALFKTTKGLLLAVLATSAFRLIHTDVATTLRMWAIDLHLNPEGRLIGRLLARAGVAEPSTLRKFAVGLFMYAAILLVEGGGLWLGQRWAEYLTVLVTASLVPIEVHHLVRRFTPTGAVVTTLNVAVVVYLIRRLRALKESG